MKRLLILILALALFAGSAFAEGILPPAKDISASIEDPEPEEAYDSDDDEDAYDSDDDEDADDSDEDEDADDSDEDEDADDSDEDEDADGSDDDEDADDSDEDEDADGSDEDEDADGSDEDEDADDSDEDEDTERVSFPAPGCTIGRDADSTYSDDDDAIIQEYTNITPEEYERFSIYLEYRNCKADAFVIEDGAVYATVTREDLSIDIVYDVSDAMLTVVYPDGTCPEPYAPYPVGSVVSFGNFGGESIQWVVLAEDGDTRTLLSVRGQNAMRFGENGSDWETSDIRPWLNDLFDHEAFSEEERARIHPGPTGDNVWLLSADEAQLYFSNQLYPRYCYPSEFAARQLDHKYDHGAGWWWLRGPCTGSRYAAIVRIIGPVDPDGFNQSLSNGLVRPSIVITLDGVTTAQ